MTRKATKKVVKKRPPRNKFTVKQVTEAMEEIGVELNEKQKRFCVLYVSDRWCFGNSTASYMEAYGINPTPKNRRTSGVSGHHLLNNPKIREYLNSLLDAQLEEVAADRILARNMMQTKDINASNTAISEYNKLKGRIKTKIVDDTGKPLQIVALAIHVPSENEK